jgi:hypothetical protein
VTILASVIRPVSFDLTRALAYAQAVGCVTGLVPFVNEPFVGMALCAFIAVLVVATSYEPRIEPADAQPARVPATSWRWMVAGLSGLAFAAAYASAFMTPSSNFTDGGPCSGPLDIPVTTLFPPQVVCELGTSSESLVGSHHFVVLAGIALPAAALMIRGLVIARRSRSLLTVVVAVWALFALALGLSSAIYAAGVAT